MAIVNNLPYEKFPAFHKLGSMTIEVHQLTNDPTAAWRQISQSQRVIKITMKPPNPAIPDKKVRIVCMSDTHSLTPHIKFDIPDGK